MNNYPTLCSSPVSIVGDVSGSMGWSDARPILGYGLQQISPGLFSGFLVVKLINIRCLPICRPVGYMIQPHPGAPYGERPAYCFHCHQF